MEFLEILNLKLSVLLLTASLALTRGHRINFENGWVMILFKN